MEIIRGVHNLSDYHKGNAVTIGNFDGVHAGHLGIIHRLNNVAKQHQVPATIITFHPTPQDYFNQGSKIPRINLFRDKMHTLEQLGIDRVVIIPFTKKLANLEAIDFIESILLEKLKVKHLIIGDDFRFGKNRKGDFALLQTYNNKNGFFVENTQTIEAQNARISSTKIRQFLSEGNLNTAIKFLGHPFCITGKVIHGDQRGRKLGFPTANIRPKHRIALQNGVYAAKVEIENKVCNAVINIGLRPTVDGSNYLIEAHIIDFNQNIYKQRISICFEKFIRPEQKFDNLNSLKEQIELDKTTAINHLTQISN